MTRSEHNRAARRRDVLAREPWSRRIPLAIGAQRRLTAQSAADNRTNPDPAGPSDPRYAYLTRTYD